MKASHTTILLAALGAVALAQKPAAEQRYFNLVNAVQHSEQLTDAELAALANDELMRTKLGAAGTKLTREGL